MQTQDLITDVMTPLEAVHFLSPFVGSDRKAKKLIADRLQDGGIEAVADWTINQIGNGPIELLPPRPQNLPDDLREKLTDADTSKVVEKRTTAKKVFAVRVRSEDEDSVEIPSHIWSQSSDYRRDRQMWNWRFGMFTVSSEIAKPNIGDSTEATNLKAPRPRFAAAGIRFSRSDIAKLVPETVKEMTIATPPKRRATKQDLEPFLIELIALGFKGKSTQEFGAHGLRDWQGKVEKWLSGRLIDNNLELGETSIRKKVQEIAAAIRQL